MTHGHEQTILEFTVDLACLLIGRDTNPRVPSNELPWWKVPPGGFQRTLTHKERAKVCLPPPETSSQKKKRSDEHSASSSGSHSKSSASNNCPGEDENSEILLAIQSLDAQNKEKLLAFLNVLMNDDDIENKHDGESSSSSSSSSASIRKAPRVSRKRRKMTPNSLDLNLGDDHDNCMHDDSSTPSASPDSASSMSDFSFGSNYGARSVTPSPQWNAFGPNPSLSARSSCSRSQFNFRRPNSSSSRDASLRGSNTKKRPRLNSTSPKDIVAMIDDEDTNDVPSTSHSNSASTSSFSPPTSTKPRRLEELPHAHDEDEDDSTDEAARSSSSSSSSSSNLRRSAFDATNSMRSSHTKEAPIDRKRRPMCTLKYVN